MTLSKGVLAFIGTYIIVASGTFVLFGMYTEASNQLVGTSIVSSDSYFGWYFALIAGMIAGIYFSFQEPEKEQTKEEGSPFLPF